MTDRHNDAAMDLVQRAHHSDPEPAGFDIKAGLADVLTRSEQQAPSRDQLASAEPILKGRTWHTPRSAWVRERVMSGAVTAREPAGQLGERPGDDGTWLGQTDGEPTLVGVERYDELQHWPVLELREQEQTHVIQRRAIAGLAVLLGVVLILGAMAMIGVASHWFTEIFALKLMSVTIAPSFAAWILILKWAFSAERQADRGSRSRAVAALRQNSGI